MLPGKDKKGTLDVALPNVMHLKTMLNYQDGAVVSKEVLKKNTGTVTLFAFDDGQGLSEHTAPFDAMVVVVEGEVEITISQKPFQLKEGDTIIMPAGRPHALKGITKFKMLLVMLRS